MEAVRGASIGALSPLSLFLSLSQFFLQFLVFSLCLSVSRCLVGGQCHGLVAMTAIKARPSDVTTSA